MMKKTPRRIVRCGRASAASLTGLALGHRRAGRLLRTALALAAGFAGLALDDHLAQGPALTTAQAVIGRPLTPMSYAGVARRTTRRVAYAGAAGAAYGAASAYAYAPPPVYAAPACTQTVDAYGRVYSTC